MTMDWLENRYNSSLDDKIISQHVTVYNQSFYKTNKNL